MLFHLRGGSWAGNTPDMAIQAIQQRPIVVLTRPAAQAERFARHLSDVDADVIWSPIMRILDVAITEDPPKDALLVFSSANAVASMAHDHVLRGRSGYAVGKSTAKALEQLGFNVLAHAPDGLELVSMISDACPNLPLVHLRGDHVAVDIASHLAKIGLNASSLLVYRQEPVGLSDQLTATLSGEVPHLFPLFSARTAILLSRELAKIRCNAPLHLVSISQAVDKSWTGPEPASRCHAAHPDAESMIEQIRISVENLT
jgi:uroporphyrinogen-III synthase